MVRVSRDWGDFADATCLNGLTWQLTDTWGSLNALVYQVHLILVQGTHYPVGVALIQRLVEEALGQEDLR